MSVPLRLLLAALGTCWMMSSGANPKTMAQPSETLVFHVDQPNVNQHETPYPQYTFRAGDRVRVSAGGCVQSGGQGKTWKRYVNPEGPNADRLYHGLISIPGATGGLVRIEGVNGREMVVSSIDPSRSFLSLGYEDDDYGDNGYSGHDDGNNDQCKGVGAAFVDITVTRSRPADEPPPKQDGSASGAAQPTGQPGRPPTDPGANRNAAPEGSTMSPKPASDPPAKGFFETVPGVLTAAAAFITAVTGLYLALRRTGSR